MQSENLKLRNKLHNKSIKDKAFLIVITGSLIFIGLLFIIESMKDTFIALNTYGVLIYDCLKTIVLACFGIFVVKIYWEISAKTDFAKQVISMCNISDNIDRSGVISIQHSYMKVNWEKFYQDAKEIDLALYHGNQTLSTCGDYIRDALKSDNPPLIRVKFPNHENISLMKQIVNLEPGSNHESVAMDISTSIASFKRMQNQHSNITIFTSDYMFPFSIYKSNQRSIVLLSKNALEVSTLNFRADNQITKIS